MSTGDPLVVGPLETVMRQNAPECATFPLAHEKLKLLFGLNLSKIRVAHDKMS
jgi:hypothetical protein